MEFHHGSLSGYPEGFAGASGPLLFCRAFGDGHCRTDRHSARVQPGRLDQSFRLFIANLFQTVPSLALLAILIPLLGIGMKPAVLALFLYSLMPILRNTYDGFHSVDKGVLQSARGMGYSTAQTILRIQLPLSLPYIMSGIRITTVYIISWATLASLIGAGGLGQLIVSGLGVNKPEMIFVGGIGAILLALVADALLGLLEGWLSKHYHQNQTRDAAV